jgi:hypothetical protein
MGSVRVVSGYILKEILIGKQGHLPAHARALTELDLTRRSTIVCFLFTRRGERSGFGRGGRC